MTAVVLAAASGVATGVWATIAASAMRPTAAQLLGAVPAGASASQAAAVHAEVTGRDRLPTAKS